LTKVTLSSTLIISPLILHLGVIRPSFILREKETREVQKKLEGSKLLLILSLILVNLEVSEGVGVFGSSDDSVYERKSRYIYIYKWTDRRKFSKEFFFKCFLVKYLRYRLENGI